MANPEHLEILKQGINAWNKWRRETPNVIPDLSGAELSYLDLSCVNLSQAYLVGASITDAKAIEADFSSANLSETDLNSSDFSRASFNNANLTDSNLCYANLRETDLRRAILSGAGLIGTDLAKSAMLGTKIGDGWLDGVIGLEEVEHWGPSSLGIETIFASKEVIPDTFLRGCGIPEDFITYMRALTVQPIQFYSCFISHSGRDEEFVRRLHSRMRKDQLRVWFAPEDMKGGDKLYDQIDRAIQVHDRLLLVLSESSLKSKWVELEIRRARKTELREGRRKLFPIRLMSYEALQEWVCIDSTTGEDLAEEVRSYFIPDFSNWKNHDDFERAFARLLTDLKASAWHRHIQTAPVVNEVQ